MKGLEDYPRPSAMSERDLLRGYGLVPVLPVEAVDEPEEPWDEPEEPWDDDSEYDRWRDQQLTDPPMG